MILRLLQIYWCFFESCILFTNLINHKTSYFIFKIVHVLLGYGLTETSPAVLFYRFSFLDIKNAKGALGKPIPNTEVKIVAVDDLTGTPLGPNELGELFVRGPQVMKGYYNRPEENVFLDGWLRTGDMMYYNEDGYLFITDRLKELIKVKGFQVGITNVNRKFFLVITENNDLNIFRKQFQICDVCKIFSEDIFLFSNWFYSLPKYIFPNHPKNNSSLHKKTSHQVY